MLQDKTILVTGGTGFVGSHFVEHLLSFGHSKLYVTQFSDSEKYVSSLLDADQILQLNLTDAEATKEVFVKVKPDLILHLASYAAVGSSHDNAQEIIENNTRLQLSVLKAMKEVVPHSRMLAVGSAEEYGMSLTPDELPITESHEFRPINPYGVSKVTQDMFSYSFYAAHKLDIVRARPFNHTGIRQSNKFIVPALAERIVAVERGESEFVEVGNLEARRDISDVLDVIKAYVLLLEKGESGEVYNVGSGKSISMQEVFDMLSEKSTAEIQIKVNPDLLRPSDIAESYASIEKIKALGWEPQISLAETLDKVLQEKRNNRTVI